MLTGWWKLTLEHSLDPWDQTNESFFQETIMSHRNKLMKPLEIAKECLLVYPSLYGLQMALRFWFWKSKTGSSMKILFSLAHIADSDLVSFSMQMDYLSSASYFRGVELFVYIFVWIYKSCLLLALRMFKKLQRY